MSGVYVLWLSVQWNRLLFCAQDHHQGGSDLSSISESTWHDLHSLVISERGLRAMAVTPNCNFGARKKEARVTLRLQREKNLYSPLLSRPRQPLWKSRKCCWNSRIYEPRHGCHNLKLSADDPDSNQRIIKACERIKSGDLPDFYDISCFKKTAEQAARECIFFFKTMGLFRRIYFFSFPNKLRYFPLSLSRNVAPCRLSPYHPLPSSLTAPDSCLSVPVQRSGGGE